MVDISMLISNQHEVISQCFYRAELAATWKPRRCNVSTGQNKKSLWLCKRDRRYASGSRASRSTKIFVDILERVMRRRGREGGREP